MRTECRGCGRDVPATETRCTKCFTFVEPRLNSAIDRYYEDSSVVSDPAADTYRKKDTFREKVRLLFPRVEAFAAEGQTTTQSALYGDGIDIWAMKHYLGAVSAIEYWDNRPLLTSVVINSERGYPAEGYFRLVERLDGLPSDITDWSPENQQAWWDEQLAAVKECWEQQALAKSPVGDRFGDVQ